MDAVLILLLQGLIYAAFPFYFATLPYHLRSISFYIYLSMLYIFGGFLGSLYSIPISESIRISGGNLNYGAFMMTIILLVIIESDMDIVRHVIRVVITVNIFKFLFYSSLSWALTSEIIINPFETAAAVFDVSIPFILLGGSLIVAELLAFLLIFTQAKRWIKNIGILALLYVVFYILVLVLDGVFFPLLAFATNPALVTIIYGNVQGKLIMGGLYAIPMLLFIGFNRQRFESFVAKELDFSDLLKTSRQALQVALHDSERRYRLLVETSPYAIAIYQKERIVFANEAASRLVGLSNDALLGKQILSLLPEERRSEGQIALEKILTDETLKTMESELLRADGSFVPVELSVVQISYQGHIAVQIIAKDISERKEAETAAKEASRLQSELEKERELAELKLRFTSMIVHDFRNPVASIALSSDLVQRYAQSMDSAKIQEKAQRISRIAKELNSQIDDFLELGHAENALIHFSPKAGDIVDFCRDLFLSFEQAHEGTTHEFRFVAALESETIRFDNHLIERMLHNLLGNAVKYSPNGGKVELQLSKTANSIEIVISDEGMGIPEKDLAHIFDFLHRASNVSSIQGTGMGLAIVRQIVEKHGGTITCQSEVNKGTRFVVNLPLE